MYLKKHERHFLCPKGGRHTSLPAVSETRLAFLVGDLQTPERKALAEICCLSHVFINDDQALLLIPHFPSIVDIQCGEKAILL